MIDVIGHSLEEGDYVTAVWDGGDVSLFQVVGEKKARAYKRFYSGKEQMIMLKRCLKKKNIKADAEDKIVLKRNTQVTWVDTNLALLYLLENK